MLYMYNYILHSVIGCPGMYIYILYSVGGFTWYVQLRTAQRWWLSTVYTITYYTESVVVYDMYLTTYN